MEANLLTILPKYQISLNQIESKPSFQDQDGEHCEDVWTPPFKWMSRKCSMNCTTSLLEWKYRYYWSNITL